MNKRILYGLFAAMFFVASAAQATPMLQLDIGGGTYDTDHEDVVASDPVFNLYAYGKTADGSGPAVDLSQTHYLSVAITPKSTIGTNFGSFSINGSSYSSGDLTYGNPPIEDFADLSGHDGGDLSPHGIFDTLFLELAFNWDPTQTRADVNVADDPGTALAAGDDLYWEEFAVDVSGLLAGFGVHFDLYTQALKDCAKNLPDACVDVDVDDFAPFSHDASSGGGHELPEPGLPMVLMGALLGLGVARAVPRKPVTGSAV